MDSAEDLEARSDTGYEAFRGLAHRVTGMPLPPADAYQLIGSLKRTPHLLPQVLTQIAHGLFASLERYEISEDPGRPLEEGEEPPDPRVNMSAAADHLLKAAKLCAQAGLELERAQSAISRQSHTLRAADSADADSPEP